MWTLRQELCPEAGFAWRPVDAGLEQSCRGFGEEMPQLESHTPRALEGAAGDENTAMVQELRESA
jgi:hypothetical protein